jgi:hypothetical protein
MVDRVVVRLDGLEISLRVKGIGSLVEELRLHEGAERQAPMTEGRLSPDGSTITVFIPLAWRRRGGHKVIVAPPGCADWAPPPKIDNALVKALAPHRWQRMLQCSEYGTLAELADAERINRSYVSRILRSRSLPRHRRTDSRRPADGRPGGPAQAIPSRVGEAARSPPVIDAAARVSTASEIPELLDEDPHFNSCTKSWNKIWEGGLVRRCLPPSLRWLRAKASWPPLSLAHITSSMSICPGSPPPPGPG